MAQDVRVGAVLTQPDQRTQRSAHHGTQDRAALQMNRESTVFWSKSDKRIMPIDQGQKIGTANHLLE